LSNFINQGKSGGVVQLATLMSQGQLLPDDIILRLLSKRLDDSLTSSQPGFILDGFPRTVHQAVCFSFCILTLCTNQ
jgi:adenylate kinase family enzyme